jgi:hypothetical protein
VNPKYDVSVNFISYACKTSLAWIRSDKKFLLCI